MKAISKSIVGAFCLLTAVSADENLLSFLFFFFKSGIKKALQEVIILLSSAYFWHMDK